MTSARDSATTNSLAPSASSAPGDTLTTACSIGNGAVFLTCHLTISCRSAALGGTFSSRNSDTFATVSGTTSATRVGLMPPSSAIARPTACATNGTSAMFNAARPGSTAPGGSASDACATITCPVPCTATRAAATWV